jgi:glycosyltransferase involved in cell wall biosynthesis
MNIAGVLAGRLARAPVVLSSQRANRHLAPFPFRHILRMTDSLVDAVVVNCRAVERHLVEEERVPLSRIRRCPNGLNVAAFHRGAGPRPQSLAEPGLTIGSVCAIRPEKNLEILITAFAQIVQPGLRLAIVGDGPMDQPLRRLARELGIEQKCIFQPGIADVAPWMAAIDVFVLPSRSEALSNSLMEAMACGCAVVASEVGGNPELVEAEVTGLLFASGDAAGLARQLDRLCGDSALRGRLASNAVDRIHSCFSMTSSVHKMQRIYLDALESAGRHA